MEAGPRALGVGQVLRTHPVLVRLAEHERWVVVEVREAESAPHDRIEERELERIERAEDRVRAVRIGPKREVERANLAAFPDDERAERRRQL